MTKRVTITDLIFFGFTCLKFLSSMKDSVESLSVNQMNDFELEKIFFANTAEIFGLHLQIWTLVYYTTLLL